MGCCFSIYPPDGHYCRGGCRMQFKAANAKGPAYYTPPYWNDDGVTVCIADPKMCAACNRDIARITALGSGHKCTGRGCNRVWMGDPRRTAGYFDPAAATPAPHRKVIIGHSRRDPRMCEECSNTPVYATTGTYTAPAVPAPAATAAATSTTSPATPAPIPAITAQSFDTSALALRRVFAPNEVPHGFVPGATVFDADAGLEATVLGCKPLRGHNEVLYLKVEGELGECPFVADWLFLKRWRVVPPALQRSMLKNGDTFVMPDLDFGVEVVLTPQMLHFQAFVTPMPLDISQLAQLGLRFGTLLRAAELPGDDAVLDMPPRSPHPASPANDKGVKLHGDPAGQKKVKPVLANKEYFVLGLHWADDCGIQLVLRESTAPWELACPAPGSKFTVMQRYLDGLFQVNGHHLLPILPTVHSTRKDKMMYQVSAQVSGAFEPHGDGGDDDRAALLGGGEFGDVEMMTPPAAASSSLAAKTTPRGGGGRRGAGGAAAIKKEDCSEFQTVVEANKNAVLNVAARAQSFSTEAALRLCIDKLKAAGGGVVTQEHLAKDDAEALRLIATMSSVLESEVPITSWFPPERMVNLPPPQNVQVHQIDSMTRDIALRNLHELGGQVGSGSHSLVDRVKWERGHYDGAYDAPGVHARDRPVFGVLNITNSNVGRVIQSDVYGSCFMVFAGTRKMTTFSVGNSGGGNPAMSTVTDHRRELPPTTANSGRSHLLGTFTKFFDTDLVHFARLVAGHIEHIENRADYKYYEHQTHQQVHFHRHVSHVVIADKYWKEPAFRSVLRELVLFCRKNACWLISRETLDRLCDMRLWSVEKLREFLQDKSAMQYVELRLSYKLCGDEEPQLVFGPQTPMGRKLFDAVCDFMCALDMARLVGVVHS